MPQENICFLPRAVDFEFEHGEIATLPEFSRAYEQLSEVADGDSILHRGTFPGHSLTLFRLPASHRLTVNSALGPLREEDGAFVMHLLGYLYGCRLQFEGWWFDGQVSLVATHNTGVTAQVAGEMTTAALNVWREWNESNRRRVTNLLFILRRADTSPWDWEQFSFYYMVFDAIYKTLADENARIPHGKRFAHVSNVLELTPDKELFARFVYMRNELVHEALWLGGQPTAGPSDYYTTGCLKRFVERAIAASLGCKGRYSSSPWHSIGASSF